MNTKSFLIYVCFFIVILSGCSRSLTEVHKDDGIKSVYAVSEVFGDGEKITTIVLEYEKSVLAKSLSCETFSVEGRTITEVFVSDSFSGYMEEESGLYVFLSLDCQNTYGFYNPDVFMNVDVRQVKSIKTKEGIVYDKSCTEGIPVILKEKSVGSFWEQSYSSQYLKKDVPYYVFLPDGYSLNIKYPLIFFISSGDKGYMSPLSQGNGAVVWTSPEEMALHPCIVVALQYPSYIISPEDEMQSDGAFVWSGALYTVRGIYDYVVNQYSVDKTRIYGIGQGNGGNAVLAMEARFSDSFSKMLVVSGQWNNFEMNRWSGKKILLVDSTDSKSALNSNNALCSFLADKKQLKVAVVKTDFYEKGTNDINSALSEQISDDYSFYHFIMDNSDNINIDSFIYSLKAIHLWLFGIH